MIEKTGVNQNVRLINSVRNSRPINNHNATFVVTNYLFLKKMTSKSIFCCVITVVLRVSQCFLATLKGVLHVTGDQ